MTDPRPNLLLLMTDQQRADCLGIARHPVLQTPHLDHLAISGCYFPHAYSAHPQCIPARRTLMTGKSARGHGVFTNYNTDLSGPTLAGELTRTGYHTHLCGKLHLHPQRKLHGFMSADWSESPYRPKDGDYQRWLQSKGIDIPDAVTAHGGDANGWVTRPFHLPEPFHFTNWVTDSALHFLERRDPTVPFFLKVSYHQPHQPCTPPQVYWNRYIDAELPEPVLGDWVEPGEHPPGMPVDPSKTELSPAQMRRFRAGYYGCVNHIDDQIARILKRIPTNTVILFVSDHGEMLGDHRLFRKTRGLEASARIPFILRFPAATGIRQGGVRDELVELKDIMPTFLDLAGAPIPDGVEGRSLMPRLRGEGDWRPWLHGEICHCFGSPTGMQYLTDGRWKYIWEPGLGRELLFDLTSDPAECRNLAERPAHASTLTTWRNRLIETIRDYPEGFVANGRLVKMSGPTRRCIPELEGHSPGNP